MYALCCGACKQIHEESYARDGRRKEEVRILGNFQKGNRIEEYMMENEVHDGNENDQKES